MTATGLGSVTLANASATSAATANAIPGPVTIDGGTVITNNEFALGAGTGTNNVVLNGGQWQANSGGTISAHNVFMGPAGASSRSDATTNFAASINDLGGQPAGVVPGPLTVLSYYNNGNYQSST